MTEDDVTWTPPRDAQVLSSVSTARLRADPRWRGAVQEAATRRLPPHLVNAWSTEYAIGTLGLAPEMVREHCQAVLDAATVEVVKADRPHPSDDLAVFTLLMAHLWHPPTRNAAQR